MSELSLITLHPYKLQLAGQFDRLQNQGLRFVCGSLWTAPISSACHIDVNVDPLMLHRERFTALTIKRMEEDNPRQMVEEWTPTERIKHIFPKGSNTIGREQPLSRRTMNNCYHPSHSTYQGTEKPKTQTYLIEKANKLTSPPTLRLLALKQ